MVYRSGGVCAIPSCNNRSIEANARSFFCFPRDHQLCSQWVQKCRRTDLQVILDQRGPDALARSYKICADHFTVKDYRNPNLSSQGLVRGSVPSLRLNESIDYMWYLKRKKLERLNEPKPDAGATDPLETIEHVVLPETHQSEDATSPKTRAPDRDPLMLGVEEQSSDDDDDDDVVVVKSEPEDESDSEPPLDETEPQDLRRKNFPTDIVFIKVEADNRPPRAESRAEPERESRVKPESSREMRDPATAVYAVDFSRVETKESSDTPPESSVAEVTFTCTACGLSFSSCNYMQQHIKHCRKLKAAYFRRPAPSEAARVGPSAAGGGGGGPPIANCTYKPGGGARKKKPGYVLATCDICGKELRNHRSLKQHMFLHRLEAGERPFACECGARFTQNCDLTKHRRQHTGEKPYVCSVCDARFTLVSNLSKHRKKHTGEKPHVCTDCGATFAESGSLTRHARQHSGERPYACPDCGATFGQSSSLTRHKRKHTGERPFVCSVCGLRFTESGNLNSHRRLHTGEKPYTCGRCGQGHARLSYLKNHARNCQAVLGT